MKWDAWSLVFTGLSLTCVTSAVLFLLVAMNPKDASYGTTPLTYAGGSVALAVAFNRASAWASRHVPQQVHRDNATECPSLIEETKLHPDSTEAGGM